MSPDLSRRTMLIALAGGFLAGCWKRKGATNLSYQLGRRAGHPALIMVDTTLVLEDVPFTGEDTDNVSAGGWMVGGRGSSGGSMGINEMSINYLYAKDVLTVTIGSHTFKLLNEGQTLELNGKEYPTKGKKTITIKADGTVTESKQ